MIEQITDTEVRRLGDIGRMWERVLRRGLVPSCPVFSLVSVLLNGASPKGTKEADQHPVCNLHSYELTSQKGVCGVGLPQDSP